MSKTYEYNCFRMKKEVPAHKLRDDLRDREARSQCRDAKKGIVTTEDQPTSRY